MTDDPFGADDNDPQTWVKVSLRSSEKFDAPLVTFTANTPEGVLLQLQDPATAQLLDSVATIGHQFSAKYKPQNGSNPPPPRRERGGDPYTAPNGRTESCTHGKMYYRTGEKSDKPGQSWQGFFCPAGKDDPGKCKARYIN